MCKMAALLYYYYYFQIISVVTIMALCISGALAQSPNTVMDDTMLRKAVTAWFTNRTTAEATYGNIADWNTSAVTSMRGLFYDGKSFNEDISKWDTAKVTDMSEMFQGASSFNQNLSKWDTSKVQTMHHMFAGATSFNNDISGWNTGQVLGMEGMFEGAVAFNQDISQWKIHLWCGGQCPAFVSTGVSMQHMFQGALAFNQDISGWDIRDVYDLGNMFNGALSFNQDISQWDTSNVIYMSGMFNGATAFNQDISKWNTSKVRSMVYMFQGAVSFNQDISIWNTSKVSVMSKMFQGAIAFKHSLCWSLESFDLKAQYPSPREIFQNSGGCFSRICIKNAALLNYTCETLALTFNVSVACSCSQPCSNKLNKVANNYCQVPCLKAPASKPSDCNPCFHEGDLTKYAENTGHGTDKLHHPGPTSGVTIGYGYDLRQRLASDVIKDLTAAGLDKATATLIAKAAKPTSTKPGLYGTAAAQFVDKNIGITIPLSVRETLFNKEFDKKRSDAQLFATSLKADSAKSNARGREILKKQKLYTYVMKDEEWKGLHPAMVDLLTDMIYQGGYYKYDRIEVVNTALKKFNVTHGKQLAQFKAVAALFEVKDTLNNNGMKVSYMDNYTFNIKSEAVWNRGETLYGQDPKSLASSFRRNSLRLANLKQIISALENGQAVNPC